jgi:hypothetical protein
MELARAGKTVGALLACSILYGVPASAQVVNLIDGPTDVVLKLDLPLGMGGANSGGTPEIAAGQPTDSPADVSASAKGLVSDSFAGDRFYRPASATATAILFAFPSEGGFVLGDQSAQPFVHACELRQRLDIGAWEQRSSTRSGAGLYGCPRIATRRKVGRHAVW